MKTRSILILSATLVIGIAIGMLISVQIQNAQMKKFRSFGSREGFKKVTFHIIEPTSGQARKIEPIIDDFTRKNDSLRIVYKKDFKALLKEYQDELYPLLTREQIQRLEEFTHPSKYNRGRRGNRGGPPASQGEKRGKFIPGMYP